MCVYRVEDLRVYASVRQFQLRSAPSHRATVGYLPAFSVQGVEHLPILRCPGAGHSPNQGLFQSFWHARDFLSEYTNYKEDITRKKADWLICQGQGVVKACSQFYACISSLLISQNYIASYAEVRWGSAWEAKNYLVKHVFWLVKQIMMLIFFEEHPFIFIGYS